MLSTRLRIARDYNRGLSALVRWVYFVAAAVWIVLGPVGRVLARGSAAYWAWASVPSRGWYLRPITVGVLAALVLLPLDGWIALQMRTFQPGGELAVGGDVRLVLNSLGQFGDFGTSVLIGWAFYLLCRNRRREIVHWIAAALVMVLVANVLKMSFGRLRPELDSPWTFLSLWNSHPGVEKYLTDLGMEQSRWVDMYSWQLWHRRTAVLWSMPSSHTAAAVLLAMMLVRINPRLAPIAWTCAGIVAFNRVFVGEHYPSDVAIGAVVGVVCVRGVFDRRLVDRARWALVPPNRRPIAPRAGRLPALANAIRVQRGEEALPEQRTMERLPMPRAAGEPPSDPSSSPGAVH